MKKILIIESDRQIAELERDYLEAEGFSADICPDGSQGLRQAGEDYDLILLEAELPGISGFDICRELRKDSDVPLIFVSARDAGVDIVRGLGLGADDYMTKPFDPAEMVARVKAHLRIHERLLARAGAESTSPPQPAEAEPGDGRDAEVIRAGDLKIMVPFRRVLIGDREVELKNKEFELLHFLASNPGIVFSRDTLFERIWGLDSAGDTATVMVHINRLRDKLETDTSNPKYIQTVWGAGYRFNDQLQGIKENQK